VQDLLESYQDAALLAERETPCLDGEITKDEGAEPLLEDYLNALVEHYILSESSWNGDAGEVEGDLDLDYFIAKCFRLEEDYYYEEAKKGKISPHGRQCRKRREKVKSSHPICDWHKPAVVSYTPEHLIGQCTPKPAASSPSKPKHSTSTSSPSSSSTSSTSSLNDSTFNESHYTRELHQNTSSGDSTSHASGLTMAQLLDLSNRELTPEDYEMLLLLDSTVAKKTCLKDQISELKETLFSANETDSSPCAVCMFDFEDGDKVKHIRCGHFFHSDCIEPWLTQHSTQCPLCKAEVF